uniref:Uncharacterized protein n=1 Tax=Tanacetum cinerariifolium TaxID=118510 RepID=A0A6L2NU04_TANCI|nr:hypothetical protein [Tanacetum cinerariifolium]
MACPLPHIFDEIQALVTKFIDEDIICQKALMELVVQFENAGAMKSDFRKAYEKCYDITHESQTHRGGPSSEQHTQGSLTDKEYQELLELQDEEVLRQTLKEEARAENEWEEKMKQEKAEYELFTLEFGVQSDSKYETD